MNLSKKNVTKILLIITFAITLFTVSQNIPEVFKIIKSFFNIISPFILGFCIAFVLNVIMKFFEEKVFAFLNRKNSLIWDKIKRPLCIVLSLFIVFAIIIILLLLIIPEINNSALLLAENLPTYMEDLRQWLIDMAQKIHLPSDTLENLNIDWEKISQDIINLLKNESSVIISTTLNVTSVIISVIVNFVLSLVFAIYLLAGKEKLISQLRRILYTLMPEKRTDYIIYIGNISNKIFSKFLIGQCTEAVILGALCYLGMTFLRMPYTLMISSLIAVTALVPMVGSFIGTIFGALLIFLVNPAQSLIFILFIIILQQIDGNLIYPRVVGKSVGLPGIWVLAAVTVGGSLYGVVGMLMSVPVSSVLYCLFKEYINNREKRTPKKVTLRKNINKKT